MKIHSLLAASVVAFTLLSCSKQGEQNPPGVGQPAKLTISVTSPNDSKATTPPGDFEGSGKPSEDVVNNFTAFITDNTGEIVPAWSVYSGSGTAVIDHTVNTGAQQVYIVANAGNLTQSITTKADLEALQINLATAAEDQTASRWSSGISGTLTFTETSGNFKATTTVALDFVAARITLKIIDGMTGYDGTVSDGSAMVLKKVAVLNARTKSKVFGTGTAPNLVVTPETWYSGIADNGFAHWPASNITEDVAIMFDAIPTDDFSTMYYYYVCENDAVAADEFPTIITIIGEIGAGVEKKEIYYPIHLAPYEQLTSGTVANGVIRGHSYDITVTLKVDPDNGGGTVDPTKPVVTADMDIQITPATWTPVVMGKEFN